jgi:hypothetical protein
VQLKIIPSFEDRAAIRFLHAGVSQCEIHHGLVSVYGQNVFSQKEVSVRCSKFKDGRTALDDPHKHTGRPRTSHNDENYVIVESLTREHRRVKVCEIA